MASEPYLTMCDGCDRMVARTHWMEWGGDLCILCDECADEALEENQEDPTHEPV